MPDDWGFPDPWSVEEAEAMRADVARLLGYDPCPEGDPLPERCNTHGTYWPHAGDLMPECPGCIAAELDWRDHAHDRFYDRY